MDLWQTGAHQFANRQAGLAQTPIYDCNKDMSFVRISLFLLVVLIYPFAWAKYKVIVDPGHGGKDMGAVRGSIREADIVLSVAKELSQLLADSEFEFALTRQENKAVELEQRTIIAHKEKGDIFISIHANSSPDFKARGTEFYFQNQLSPDQDSLFLANRENENPDFGVDYRPSQFEKTQKKNVANILDDMMKNNYIHLSAELALKLRKSFQLDPMQAKHKIRQAPFHVVSTVNMPSVLIELGFITNPNDAKLLTQKDYHRQLAKNIFLGLQGFKETLDKSHK